MSHAFKSLGLAAAVAVLGLTVPPAQATEPVTTVNDDFSCRASALRVKSPLVNSEPITANKLDPSVCRDDSNTLANITVGPVSTSVLNASTDAQDDGGQAKASVDNLTVVLGTTTIKATVLSSKANSTCVDGQPKLSGSSKVVGLKINGQSINVIDQPVTIPAAPLLVVAINEKTVDQQNNKITQRALHIYSAALGIDIVVAESIADVNSCPTPLPECSDGLDNDGDGLIDAADPGCHTDGDPNNPGSYDPADNDETNQPPACSDGLDNDGDGLIDQEDPGCHTDGDPNNPDSYDPNDDDEFNPSQS